jgi:hypothetical protein
MTEGPVAIAMRDPGRRSGRIRDAGARARAASGLTASLVVRAAHPRFRFLTPPEASHSVGPFRPPKRLVYL